MEKFKKIIFFIIIIVLVIFGVFYLDYFKASSNHTAPKLSIKEELNGDLFVYNSLFYRMWYCKPTDTYTIGSYSDVDAICTKEYTYENGYYTNEAGLKISQKDLEMVKGIYDAEVIETFNSDSVLESAIYVVSNYNKLDYKKAVSEDGEELLSDKYQLVYLKEFKENNGKFDWIYNEGKLYCLDSTEEIKKISDYDGEKCGEFDNLVYTSKWCELYTNSNLAFNDDINKICKSE